MHSVIDSMFYSGIHAAFKGVSALLGALTPAKGRKRTEGEANADLLYDPKNSQTCEESCNIQPFKPLQLLLNTGFFFPGKYFFAKSND